MVSWEAEAGEKLGIHSPYINSHEAFEFAEVLSDWTDEQMDRDRLGSRHLEIYHVCETHAGWM